MNLLGLNVIVEDNKWEFVFLILERDLIKLKEIEMKYV